DEKREDRENGYVGKISGVDEAVVPGPGNGAACNLAPAAITRGGDIGAQVGIEPSPACRAAACFGRKIKDRLAILTGWFHQLPNLARKSRVSRQPSSRRRSSSSF